MPETKLDHGENSERVSSRPLLALNEAAARVGLKHLALRRAIQRGELPAAKLCSRIRIDPIDLERWIARGFGERDPSPTIDSSAQKQALQAHDPAGRPGRAGAAGEDGQHEPG